MTASMFVTAHTSTPYGATASFVEERTIAIFGGIVDSSFRPIPGAQLIAIPEASSIILIAVGLGVLTLLNRNEKDRRYRPRRFLLIFRYPFSSARISSDTVAISSTHGTARPFFVRSTDLM